MPHLLRTKRRTLRLTAAINPQLLLAAWLAAAGTLQLHECYNRYNCYNLHVAFRNIRNALRGF